LPMSTAPPSPYRSLLETRTVALLAGKTTSWDDYRFHLDDLAKLGLTELAVYAFSFWSDQGPNFYDNAVDSPGLVKLGDQLRGMGMPFGVYTYFGPIESTSTLWDPNDVALDSDGLVKTEFDLPSLTDAAIHDEVEFPRPLAPPLPVDVSVALLREEQPGTGATRPIVVTIRDRSAARSLREEIRERERQESYGHIAAGIAHEVKNPLGGIRGAAELLSIGAKNDRARKAADLIVGEVDRISGLVDELMVFARGEALDVEDVNIHKPLDSLLDLLELERGYEGIEVRRVYDPSLPELQADPARLQQVFLNLARNAMQAMEDTGGTLTLSTGMTLEHRLVGPDGRPRPTIEVSVSDTGPGIPPDTLDRLSTPFFTTKQKGTGLGLSVARHWIRRHGGRLRLDSVVGEGTRVAVDLPLTPLVPQPANTRDAPPKELPA
ncbi:MAG: ATP-binding protein, partial [Myxococcota bacterium]